MNQIIILYLKGDLQGLLDFMLEAILSIDKLVIIILYLKIKSVYSLRLL